MAKPNIYYRTLEAFPVSKLVRELQKGDINTLAEELHLEGVMSSHELERIKFYRYRDIEQAQAARRLVDVILRRIQVSSSYYAVFVNVLRRKHLRLTHLARQLEENLGLTETLETEQEAVSEGECMKLEHEHMHTHSSNRDIREQLHLYAQQY